jgi:predicted transcriptional regulator
MKEKKKSAGQSGTDGNDELRIKTLKINVSPTEFEKLSKFYDLSPQRTFAQFCRDKLLTKPGSVTSNAEIKAQHTSLINQLNKIGSNLNQIAKKINTLKKDYPELIDELRDELLELKRVAKNSHSKKLRGD